MDLQNLYLWKAVQRFNCPIGFKNYSVLLGEKTQKTMEFSLRFDSNTPPKAEYRVHHNLAASDPIPLNYIIKNM